MSQLSDPDELEIELAELETRISELRQAAEIPGATLRPTLEAALVELELAADMLTKLRARIATGATDAARRPGPADVERRLLRAVFQDAPAPIFLLETDGTVRRANRQAGGLLGVPPGYTTGKPFTAFVDLPGRAAMKTQFNALVRTRRPRRTRCQLQGTSGKVETVLTIDLVELAGEPEPLIVAVAGPAASAPAPKRIGARDGHPGRGGEAVHRAVADATQRLDLMTATTRLLLENATFNEAVTLQRCARLLAAELRSWVIVDVVHDDAVAPPVRGRPAWRAYGRPDQGHRLHLTRNQARFPARCRSPSGHGCLLMPRMSPCLASSTPARRCSRCLAPHRCCACRSPTANAATAH